MIKQKVKWGKRPKGMDASRWRKLTKDTTDGMNEVPDREQLQNMSGSTVSCSAVLRWNVSQAGISVPLEDVVCTLGDEKQYVDHVWVVFSHKDVRKLKLKEWDVDIRIYFTATVRCYRSSGVDKFGLKYVRLV